MKSPMPIKPSIPGTLLRILGVVVVAALLVGVVLKTSSTRNAQAGSTSTCNSIHSGDWTDPASWSCSGGGSTYPGSNDTAVIDNQDITISVDQSVQDVTVHSNASLTVSSGKTLTIGGILHVSATNGLNTVFYDDVTFLPTGGGTIEFGPDGNQSLMTDGAWLFFWNLTKTGTGTLSVNSCNSDLSECGGKFEVVNTLTLTGTAPTYMLLRSSIDGQGWTFVSQKPPVIDWVDVKDSINEGEVINVSNGKDSGGNSGWKFVGLHSSLNPSMVEQDVTLTMTLPDNTANPTLAFMEGIVKLSCTDPVSNTAANPVPVVDGTASCVTSDLGVGSHTISVAYYDQSGLQTATLVQVVNQSTELDLHSSPSPSVKDGLVTFTAAVMPPNASGTVNFADGGSLIADCMGHSIDPATGFATCTVALNTVGNHIITAEFIPNASDTESSHSAPLIQTVKNLTSVVVSTSTNKIDRYKKVTLTATTNSLVAGGVVTFYENGNLIAGCTSVAVSGNQAACEVSSLKPGSHNITVFYSGDATDFSSTSPAVVLKVNYVTLMPWVRK